MRFYAIQIDTIFLTSNGSNTGTPCKLTVSNVEDLLTNVIGAAVPTVGGNVVFQLVPFTRGKQFDIQIEVLNLAQWNDLKTLINSRLAADTSFTVSGTGDTGNFSVSAKPFPQKPFSAQSFLNNRINGVTLKFITF